MAEPVRTDSPGLAEPATAKRAVVGYSFAGLLFALGVVLSVWIWHRAAEDLRTQAEANFDHYTSLAFANVTQTVRQQFDLVLAFQTLYRTGTPNDQDFDRLKQDLRLDTRDLGVEAVAFAADLADIERAAFGVAARSEAGQAQLSGPLRLVQGHTGYVIRVPVYKAHAWLETEAQRSAAYLGQVNGVFKVDALLNGAKDFGHTASFGLAIRDLGSTQINATLPSSTLVAERPLDTSQYRGATWAPTMTPAQRRQHVEFGGRIWALEASAQPIRHGLSSWPMLLLAIGLALSAALAGTVAWSSRTRERATVLANRMSNEARTTAKRLDAVVNNAAEGILTLDAMGHVRSANQAARAMFGLDQATLIGGPLGGLMAPVGDNSAAKRTHDLLDPDSLGTRRSQMALRADGTPFPVEVVIAAADVDGERHRVATVRDMTESKAAEDAVDMTLQELQQATELRESMLRHAAFAILLCGPDGMVRTFNPAAEKLLQRTAAGVIGQMRLEELIAPKDLQLAATTARERLGVDVAPGLPALVTELAHQTHVERELHLLRQDGRQVPVSLTITSLGNDANHPSDYLVITYDVTERRQLSAQLATLAYTDGLTGLPNRVQLERELNRVLGLARRHGRHFALLFIDLDRFKPINDRYGHAMGDDVLREVASRLPNLLRSTDMCARIGGDEFVILLSEVAQPTDSLVVADKVVARLSEPMHLNGEILTVGASVGIVTYPEGGDDVETLLRHADAAMYQVKQSGRNGFHLKAPA